MSGQQSITHKVHGLIEEDSMNRKPYMILIFILLFFTGVVLPTGTWKSLHLQGSGRDWTLLRE
jgi:hypothetical protein